MLVVGKGGNGSPPHDVAFGIRETLKKRGGHWDCGCLSNGLCDAFMLLYLLVPDVSCVNESLALRSLCDSARRVKVLADARSRAVRPRLALPPRGLLAKTFVEDPASSGKHVCRTVLVFVLQHLHAHRIPSSVSL